MFVTALTVRFSKQQSAAVRLSERETEALFEIRHRGYTCVTLTRNLDGSTAQNVTSAVFTDRDDPKPYLMCFAYPAQEIDQARSGYTLKLRRSGKIFVVKDRQIVDFLTDEEKNLVQWLKRVAHNFPVT